MDLKSKTAIVTGASKGLGKAIAEALVKKEVEVYGLARSEEELKKIQQKLGSRFHPVTMDLTNEQKVRDWVKSTFEGNKAVDILINNAGVGYFRSIDELSSEKWHQMMNINLNAVFYLTQEVVPLMKSNGSFKHIVNIGSIVGKTTGSEKSGYSSTKFAIQGFSEALFKELRGFKIKVSCINPGSIETDFFEDSGIEPNPSMLQPADVAATIVHVLETPDNVLIDELTLRPLIPKR